jgi:hypothetical protein
MQENTAYVIDPLILVRVGAKYDFVFWNFGMYAPS